jgi:hypothetical protein
MEIFHIKFQQNQWNKCKIPFIVIHNLVFVAHEYDRKWPFWWNLLKSNAIQTMKYFMGTQKSPFMALRKS